jgi:hypothetical protein
MATFLDKRRRNARPSKYRPRTESQKQRRRELWEARAETRKARQDQNEETRLLERLAELESALRDLGRGGIHGRRHTRALEDITDDAERFAVLRARVERLEALWSIDRRKRETRGKIIIGGAMLAELIDAVAVGDTAFLHSLLDVLDRRVDAVRDRLTVKELLGQAPLPLRPGGDAEEPVESALSGVFESAPDFDAMVQSAMAEEVLIRPADVDADYAEIGDNWAPPQPTVGA